MTTEEALDAFLSELENDYLKWYEKAQFKWLSGYVVLQVSALFLGFIATVIAALIDQEGFGHWRIALILLPLISSLIGAILTQAKFSDMLRLREEGRIAILDLIYEANEGIQRTRQGSDEAKFALFAELRKKLMDIERSQYARSSGLWTKDFTVKFEK